MTVRSDEFSLYLGIMCDILSDKEVMEFVKQGVQQDATFKAYLLHLQRKLDEAVSG